MMSSLSVLFLIFASVARSEELQNAPGRAAFWSPAQSIERAALPEYRTQSMVMPQVNVLFYEKSLQNEIVAVIKSTDGRPILSHSSVKDSIRASSSSIILPNVYLNELPEVRVEMLSRSANMDDVKKIDLKSFVQILRDFDESSAAVGPMNDGQLNSYEIEFNGLDAEQEHMNTIGIICAKYPNKVLFAAAEEPMEKAILPSRNGEFSRVLTSTASSSNIDGIFYKPEGSEYAIYYADTYLYITPDIFTGIMTGIFVFFVLLTGYSCLGAIQGNSVYPSKMPVLGREA